MQKSSHTHVKNDIIDDDDYEDLGQDTKYNTCSTITTQGHFPSLKTPAVDASFVLLLGKNDIVRYY